MSKGRQFRSENVEALLDSEEVKALLHKLCVKLGFCLPPIEIERMATSPPRCVDEFTRAVFLLEGLELISDRQLVKQGQEIVTEAFFDHLS
jgi:hypothetical protein